MSGIDFDQFLEKLSSISERDYIDPASLQWPEAVDLDAWYFTPELISIFGSDTWHSMDEIQQKRLSFFEAVNFFSLNIHGEKYLISEISRRLFDSDNSKLSSYLLHFVDEESRHMMYFSGFCQRYAGEIYPDRTIHGNDSDDAEYDMFMLFARINVFEEIVDHYNKTMASDERLAPVIREINRIHHVEEVRHLAFGRKFLKQCLDRNISTWGNSRRTELQASLMEYLDCVWKEYYNPRIYKDAGLQDSFQLWQTTASSLAATHHRNIVNRERLKFLTKMNLLRTV